MIYLRCFLQIGAAEFTNIGASECGLIFSGLVVVIASLLIGVRILWKKIEKIEKRHNKIITNYRNEITDYHTRREDERQELFTKFDNLRQRNTRGT